MSSFLPYPTRSLSGKAYQAHHPSGMGISFVCLRALERDTNLLLVRLVDGI